jgi:SAM-dependent methyltransferase
MSGVQGIYGDLPYSKEKVEQAFTNKGLVPSSYLVDVEAYTEYVGIARYPDGTYGDYFAEKSLEHFISFQFSDINEHSLVVDVANASSHFPRIMHDLFGCRVISNDLEFPAGVVELADWHTQIGCNACNLPLNDGSVDLMTLHCALEMFEGNDDISLIREASRVLKPGGKMVIVPLYLNEVHHVLRDPINPRRTQPIIDNGSVLVYRHDFFNVAFARFYSVDALFNRLLSDLVDMSFNLYKVEKAESIGKNVYCSWIGVFEKITGGIRFKN